MIVKFHPRGRGGGAGPVDYLLGKDRQREGASVLQGKPEEVRELIDASPYVKKYTSGVLSFAEADLPSGQREKLMASFERVLMPGLDKDQYSILYGIIFCLQFLFFCAGIYVHKPWAKRSGLL